MGAIAFDKSPLTLKDQKLGKYPVRVHLDGYEDWTGEVEVKENEFAELDIPLVRSTGGVQISSTPSGLHFILTSGVTTLEGTTPATLPALPTGDYSLKVQRAGWPDTVQNVVVKREAQTGTSAVFPGGTLEISSTPEGAAVWTQGKNLGTTPFRLADLPPGPVEVEYRLKGYKAAPASSVVKAGETAGLAVVLERLSDRDPTGEIAALEKNWAEYKRIATQIQQLAAAGTYRQVTDEMVLSLDQYVAKVSAAVGKLLPGSTVVFYDLPVSVTGTMNGSPKSIEWSKDHKTDHWVIQSNNLLAIAWRQDAAYFCFAENGKVTKDGFAEALRRGDEVIRRLLRE